jgi:NADH-quinone oxidoreductase subunit E
MKLIIFVQIFVSQAKALHFMKDINEGVVSIIRKYPNVNRDTLIPMLQDVQDTLGYISEEVINEISIYLDLPTSKIYGLASFYNQFRFTPIGKYHIRVCDGTACHMERSDQIITEISKILKISDGETTRDGLFSLEILSCIGACGQAPVISVNGKYYGKVAKSDIKMIINSYKEIHD